jgi:hypothetical protein
MTTPAMNDYCTTSPTEHIINEQCWRIPLSTPTTIPLLWLRVPYPAPIVDDLPNLDMSAVWRDVACCQLNGVAPMSISD